MIEHFIFTWILFFNVLCGGMRNGVFRGCCSGLCHLLYNIQGLTGGGLDRRGGQGPELEGGGGEGGDVGAGAGVWDQEVGQAVVAGGW